MASGPVLRGAICPLNPANGVTFPLRRPPILLLLPGASALARTLGPKTLAHPLTQTLPATRPLSALTKEPWR